jgi:D-alanyl-lipoteichoic acid acyltransferase DltB (MBOAT superfamily)
MQRNTLHRRFLPLCVLGSATLTILVGGRILQPDPLVSSLYRSNLPMAILAGLLVNPQPLLLSLCLLCISFLLVVTVSAVARKLAQNPGHLRYLKSLTITGLIGTFVFARLNLLGINSPPSQQVEWVGLSYLLFRLIHVVVDSEKLGLISTRHLTAYALFPFTLIAGPIQRANQFLPQLDKPRRPASRDHLIECLWRICLGITKKLVLANALSLVALDQNIATNPHASRALLWVSLIAFAFMLYFDFAGYSDIAIGAAGLIGITLPENFANPYAQPSVARFWQTWHMSLSSWLRDYIFFPLSRILLKRCGRTWVTATMAFSHLVTMSIAGLWHGFSTGYLAWGIWHGIGLFANAQGNKFLRRNNREIPYILSVIVTFLFVLIGWIFFALPTLDSGLHFLMRLLVG